MQIQALQLVETAQQIALHELGLAHASAGRPEVSLSYLRLLLLGALLVGRIGIFRAILLLLLVTLLAVVR